jgi:uncharacterized Rmd1/YagE family protein
MLGSSRRLFSFINRDVGRLVSIPTPIPILPDQSKVSARVLLPRGYEFQKETPFGALKSVTDSRLDLRFLGDRITHNQDRWACDRSGSYLYINFFEGDKYQNTAIVFPDGALVTWYMDREQELSLASQIVSARVPLIGRRKMVVSSEARERLAVSHIDSLQTIESIPIDASPSPVSRLIPADGSIVLVSDEARRSDDMLVISMALAAAVRLNLIEESIEEFIETGHRRMAGINSNSVKAFGLARMSERIFESEKYLHKWRYHLNTDEGELLTVPDLLWEFEPLDRLYGHISNHFDVRKRINELNSQLTHYAEFLTTVGDYIRHRYSSRLERIIIGIIAIEAALAFRHFVIDVIESGQIDDNRLPSD